MPRDEQLIQAGKEYGAVYSIWGKFRDIIERGSRYLDVNPSLLPDTDRSYREEYVNLISVEPKIPDLAANHPLTDIVVQLDKGRKEFRNSQVHSISNRIPSWGFKVPQDKQLRGFGDDVCGKLLCPSTQDWGNPTTREQIRLFQVPVTADDFPKFLWEGERVDPQDMNKGFLRGELLIKVLLCMLVGPAAACSGSRSSGAGGYADRFNLKTITIPLLAFAAIAAHHALTSELVCHWAYKNDTPGFNNLAFYERIISTVGRWKEEDKRSLLLWWNRLILPRVSGSTYATSFGNAPMPGSAAAMMLQQAGDVVVDPQ